MFYFERRIDLINNCEIECGFLLLNSRFLSKFFVLSHFRFSFLSLSLPPLHSFPLPFPSPYFSSTFCFSSVSFALGLLNLTPTFKLDGYHAFLSFLGSLHDNFPPNQLTDLKREREGRGKRGSQKIGKIGSSVLWVSLILLLGNIVLPTVSLLL